MSLSWPSVGATYFTRYRRHVIDVSSGIPVEKKISRPREISDDEIYSSRERLAKRRAFLAYATRFVEILDSSSSSVISDVELITMFNRHFHPATSALET